MVGATLFHLVWERHTNAEPTKVASQQVFKVTKNLPVLKRRCTIWDSAKVKAMVAKHPAAGKKVKNKFDPALKPGI